MATGDATMREAQGTQGKGKEEGRTGEAGRLQRRCRRFDGENQGQRRQRQQGGTPARLGQRRQRRGNVATAQKVIQ